MKIICQSCGAKYTIADEKVRGRTVKIRCKKCSSAIVVKGPEEMPPPEQEEEEEDDATRVYSGGEMPEGMAMSIPPQGADPGWMVTLDDGAQREGSIEELRAMYEAGTIHDDSYVWRDGMGDWQTIADTPDLQSSLRERPVRSGPPRPTRSGAPSPDAKLGAGLFGGGGAAARVDTRGREQDLFGAPEQPPPEEEVATSAPSNPMAKPPIPKFTAERGENSVLFTIDTMKAMGNQPSGTSRPASAAPSGDEKIDIGALASVAPPPIMPDFDQSYDPGPSFGASAGGSLAAPMLPTTIEPEPEPIPEPMPYDGSFEPQPKSNKGVIIGLGAAVALLLIVSLAFGGYVLFGEEEAPVAVNTTTEGTEKAGADTAKDDTDKDTTDDDKKDDDAKDDDKKDEEAKDDDKKDEEAKADDKKDDAKKGVKAAATPTIGGPLPTPTAKKDDKKDTKKDDAKKDDKTEEPKTPAATADRKFSRGAAISALGAAAGAASGCKKPGGPTGRGRVSVTFAPSGRVTTAVVNGAPFAGTTVGGCVAAAFRRASVPPFDGSPVTVHKSFSIN